jgi:biotin carboxyl carrier protein
MGTRATSGGRTYRVDVHPDADGLHVHLDDQVVPVDVLPVGPACYSILCHGRSYEVDCLPVEDAWIVLVDGQPFRVVLQDEGGRGPAPPASEAPPPRSTPVAGTLTAPMPGKVVKVHVQVGETVRAGTLCVTLEAMKMENELMAPVGGIVIAVPVVPGATVRAGETLVEITESNIRSEE